MKITIKTLQQKLFTVDVEPEDTVATIKTKINADHGHPVESQKLIYSGMYHLHRYLCFGANSNTLPPN
jgi:UV excision repair protein RAD23